MSLNKKLQDIESRIAKLESVNYKKLLLVEIKNNIEKIVDLIETKCDIKNKEIQEFKTMCMLFDTKVTNQLNDKQYLNDGSI